MYGEFDVDIQLLSNCHAQVYLELFKTYCDYSTSMQYNIPNDTNTVMCGQVWSYTDGSRC